VIISQTSRLHEWTRITGELNLCSIGWIRNFVNRNFTKNYFSISRNCHIISRNFGKQQKITMATLSAKFHNIYWRNFADFHEIIWTKFREINFNFVFCGIKNRLSYPFSVVSIFSTWRVDRNSFLAMSACPL
jgi:uncharacterized protein with HEPN domain